VTLASDPLKRTLVPGVIVPPASGVSAVLAVNAIGEPFGIEYMSLPVLSAPS
jgi:hypothetical protein